MIAVRKTELNGRAWIATEDGGQGKILREWGVETSR